MLYLIKLAKVFDYKGEYHKADAIDKMIRLAKFTIKKIGDTWYTNVDYHNRNLARVLGFRWEPTKKLWYTKDQDIIRNLDPNLFDDREEVLDDTWKTIMPLDPYELNVTVKTNGLIYQVSGPGLNKIQRALHAAGFHKSGDIWMTDSIGLAKTLMTKQSFHDYLQNNVDLNYKENFVTKESNGVRKAILYLIGLNDLNPEKDFLRYHLKFLRQMESQIKTSGFLSPKQLSLCKKILTAYLPYIPRNIVEEMYAVDQK